MDSVSDIHWSPGPTQATSAHKPPLANVVQKSCVLLATYYIILHIYIYIYTALVVVFVWRKSAHDI